MPLTMDSINKHKIPAPKLTQALHGHESDHQGNLGASIVIPAGSRYVAGHPTDLLLLLGIYGEDQTVAHFILPEGRIITAFFRITDAIKALPADLPEFVWDTASQTYVPKTYPVSA